MAQKKNSTEETKTLVFVLRLRETDVLYYCSEETEIGRLELYS